MERDDLRGALCRRGRRCIAAIAAAAVNDPRGEIGAAGVRGGVELQTLFEALARVGIEVVMLLGRSAF